MALKMTFRRLSLLTRLTVEELSRMSHFPTFVEPVNEIFRNNSLWHMAVPTSTTSWRPTVRQLITPGGTPASSAIAHKASADRGVSSDGLMTTVQPAARAGPI